MTDRKVCVGCLIVYPAESFPRTRNGWSNYCQECKVLKYRAARIAQGKNVSMGRISIEERNRRSLAKYHRNREQYLKRRQEQYEHVLSIERASRDRNKEKQRPKKNERQRLRNRQKTRKFYVSQRELEKLYSQPCHACGSTEQPSIDHIIPLALGGHHSIGNLWTLCRPCNSSKGARLLVEWRLRRSLVAS